MDKGILLNNIPIEAFDGKSVLITGATGIVGTHFLYAFYYMIEEGIDVQVTAIYASDIPIHLLELSRKKNFGFVKCDLSHICAIPPLPVMDFVIHGANYGQPYKFVNKAKATISLNTTTLSYLLSVVLKPQGSLLFISSSEVYSGLTNPPFVEENIGTTDPLHPRACYIESKRCGETIVNTYRNHGVNTKSVRLSLAYGEGTRENDHRVLNQFIQGAIINGKIKLRDSGHAMRTYCYVGDAVNMMLTVMLRGKQPVYNIGGDITLSISMLAHLIGGIMDVTVIVPDDNDNDGSPSVVMSSLRRYLHEFGKRDFLPMDEGIKRTIAFQKKLYR